MKILVLILRAIVCALTGPLWSVGLVVSWARWLVDKVVNTVIRWLFWEPCSRSWQALIRAWRALQWDRARKTPEIADELERVRKANEFTRRARRVGRRH